MQETNATRWDENGQLEVLTFNLDQEIFALEATLVREILDIVPETRVPSALPLVGSVINFRGKIIPIVDLRLAFGMKPIEDTGDSRIVVIEMEVGEEPIQIGIHTDAVNEVTTLDRSASEEPPVVGMRWRRDYVREFVRRSGGVVVLPDLDMIFHEHRGKATSVAAAPPVLN